MRGWKETEGVHSGFHGWLQNRTICLHDTNSMNVPFGEKLPPNARRSKCTGRSSLLPHSVGKSQITLTTTFARHDQRNRRYPWKIITQIRPNLAEVQRFCNAETATTMVDTTDHDGRTSYRNASHQPHYVSRVESGTFKSVPHITLRHTSGCI